MSIIKQDYGEIGGSAKGETFVIPNDGATHTYEYTCTNACIYIFYNTTINVTVSVIEGILYTDNLPSDVSVTYLSGVLNITLASRYWGNTVRIVYS